MAMSPSDSSFDIDNLQSFELMPIDTNEQLEVVKNIFTRPANVSKIKESDMLMLRDNFIVNDTPRTNDRVEQTDSSPNVIQFSTNSYVSPSITPRPKESDDIVKKNSFIINIMKDEAEKELPCELKFIEERLKEETKLEEEHDTKEYFMKTNIDEVIAFIFAFMGIGSGMVYRQLWTLKKTANQSGLDSQQLELAIFLSLIIVSTNLFFFSMFKC